MGDETDGENQVPEGQDETQQAPQQQETQPIGGDETKEGYEAALAERDAKIAELEKQVADAAKNAEAAEELAKQIGELKEASAAERAEYELKDYFTYIRASVVDAQGRKAWTNPIWLDK